MINDEWNQSWDGGQNLTKGDTLKTKLYTFSIILSESC
jgi:hypothetical protein